ncbi:MAG: HAD-IIIA family hydrolase [SAR324 cluster bacterium]|nr:HAD-IIIA family hydrolase [SAR324 cluster bacterium]
MDMIQETIFLDRDGVINEEPGPILTPEQLLFIPGSLEAIQRINQQKKLCIVITNQAAIARKQLSQEVFEQICLKLSRHLENLGAHIDDLFYCPHYPHWEEGWSKALCHPCECRKPGTLLFKQAAQRYNIDFKKSIFIGDTTSDFEAAKRLGMRSIGVRTGHGGQDGKCPCHPDSWAENLQGAVNLLETQ